MSDATSQLNEGTGNPFIFSPTFCLSEALAGSDVKKNIYILVSYET